MQGRLEFDGFGLLCSSCRCPVRASLKSTQQLDVLNELVNQSGFKDEWVECDNCGVIYGSLDDFTGSIAESLSVSSN